MSSQEYMYRTVVTKEKLDRLSKEMHSCGRALNGAVELLAEKFPELQKDSDFRELTDIYTRLKVYSEELAR